MSNDRLTFGAPYREPAAQPPQGTTPIQFLRNRQHFDPIADACLKLLRNAGGMESDALVAALHSYATGLDEVRRQLTWYMERCAPIGMRVPAEAKVCPVCACASDTGRAILKCPACGGGGAR